MHGATYKHLNNKEYKDDFAKFFDTISSISALVSRKKQFDKTGKINIKEELLQRKARFETLIKRENKQLKDQEEELLLLSDSIANRKRDLKKLEKNKDKAGKLCKNFQIF